MLLTIDRFLGNRIFIPPTIKICQMTGWTQYQFARYLFMVAYFWWVYTSKGFLNLLLGSVLALIMTVLAALMPVMMPRQTSHMVRMFQLGFCLVCLFSNLAGTSKDYTWAPFFALILWAEYASSIHTIPPKKKKEKKKAMKAAAAFG